MTKPIMFVSTVTCDEHDDCVIVYRSTMPKCPMCELEAQLQYARETVKEIKGDLERITLDAQRRME